MRPLSKLLLALAIAASCPFATSAAVIFNLSNVALDGAPGENTFVANTTNSSAVSGALTYTIGNSGTFSFTNIYFASQTLTNIGDSLTVSYAFTPSGSNTFNTSGSANGAMRVGLLNSGGTPMTSNISSAADAAFTGDAGYLAMYRPASGTNATSNTFYLRDGTGGTASALWDGSTRDVLAGPTLTSPGTSAVVGSFSVTRVATGIELSSVINGGGAQTFIDTSSTVTTYDYFSFFGLSGVNGGSVTFSSLTVDFTPVPETSPSLLIGVLGLIFVVQRRYRRQLR